MNNCLLYKSVRLLPYSLNHCSQTVEWLNQPEIYSEFGLTHRVTEDSHKKWLKALINTEIWAIHEHNTNEYVGNVILFRNTNHKSAEFQIYLGNKKFHSKGLGEATMVTVLNFAYEELNINRIWLIVLPNNIKAIRLYEKLGFQLEGIERESHFYNLKFTDQYKYSMLKSEWESKRERIIK